MEPETFELLKRTIRVWLAFKARQGDGEAAYRRMEKILRG